MDSQANDPTPTDPQPQPQSQLQPQEPAPRPQWKQDLLRALFAMVEALPDEEPPPDEFNTESAHSQQPTLQEFYAALIALEANTRKNVQKTNASLDTVAKSLRALQRQMSQIEERSHLSPSTDPTPLLSLDGQLRRMSNSLQSPPAPAPLGLSRKWQTAWADVANGAEIILNSLAQVLTSQGIRSHSPALGDAFDPASMEAVKVTPHPQAQQTGQAATQAEVVEVIEPAYYQDKTLIRAARVHVQR
jgi:hypothetical protein